MARPSEHSAVRTNLFHGVDIMQESAIRANLDDGINVMRDCGWIYPEPSVTNLARDSAAKGFKKFYSGTLRMNKVAERFEHVEQGREYVAKLTQEWDALWVDVLCFLATMGAARKAYTSQISFIIATWSEWSPAFLSALSDTHCHIPAKLSEDDHIRKNLWDGVNVMRSFDWIYPPPSATDVARDEATEGFKKFLNGATRVSKATERFQKEDKAKEYVANLTKDLDGLWPNVLSFLGTMGMARKVYTTQINFATATLSEFSPPFASALLNLHVSASDRSQSHQSFESESQCDSVMSKEVLSELQSDVSTSPTKGGSCESRLSVTNNEAMVKKGGWRRSCLYNSDLKFKKEIAKLEDGASVRVLYDGPGEYAKVEIVGWVKRSELVSPEIM
mmetsp:Transcript_11196/g.21072  ORF Transcript_11196/g.21072 Transcript_11196/m.21072 type:complete len:390 (+) Transcript_11196:32-1201(+)